jgi:hypothetical protein
MKMIRIKDPGILIPSQKKFFKGELNRAIEEYLDTSRLPVVVPITKHPKGQGQVVLLGHAQLCIAHMCNRARTLPNRDIYGVPIKDEEDVDKSYGSEKHIAELIRKKWRNMEILLSQSNMPVSIERLYNGYPDIRSLGSIISYTGSEAYIEWLASKS